MTKPDFVIIGAQKSGSTSLMRHLADHPALYIPDNEIRYFRDPWFQFEDPSILSEVVAGAGPDVERRGFTCPDLLALPTSPQRIRDELGVVDLIAILRDPVWRAVSAYYWYMQWSWLPIAPIETGMRRVLDGSYDADYPHAAEILEYGRYGTQLGRFLELFPRERIHVTLSDELRSDSARATADVFRFLGVDPDVQITPPSRNNTGVYSFRRLKWLQLRHRWVMREVPGYPGKFREKPNTVHGWVVDRSVVAIDRTVLTRVCDNSQPSTSAELQAQLREYFRDEVQLLSQTLSRDLGAWLSPA